MWISDADYVHLLMKLHAYFFFFHSVSECGPNGAEPGLSGRGRSHSRLPAAALQLLQRVAVPPAQTAPRCSGKSRETLHASRDVTTPPQR